MIFLQGAHLGSTRRYRLIAEQQLQRHQELDYSPSGGFRKLNGNNVYANMLTKSDIGSLPFNECVKCFGREK